MKTLLALAVILALTATPLPADDAGTPLPTDDPKAVELYRACDKGAVADVRELVASGAPVDGQVGRYRYTPLIAVACDSHLEVLKFLIDCHANVNLPDSQGSTALLHACWEDHAPCALALIDGGADVNLASEYGRTPLMYAAFKGDDTIIQALIAHHVKLDATCDDGSAITWAANSNHLSTVKLLGDAGANPNLLPSHPGAITALGGAAKNNNPDMIDYLLGLKADVNAVDGEGQTALFVAANWRRTEAALRLIAAGANPNVKNKEGRTALMQACVRAQLDIARALADAKADLDATDKQGETALALAGDTGETAIVQMLKDHGAKKTDLFIIPKGPDGYGLTEAKAWALAVGAIYCQRDSANPRVLGGNRMREDAQSMLQRDWGITDDDSLLKEVAHLRDQGHHAKYLAEGAKLDQMSDDDFEKLVDAHEDKESTIRGLRSSYRKWKDRTGLAWDLCRAANLVSNGLAANYLDAQQAWDQLMLIAKEAQGSFGSWQELSDNFLDGREIWANTRDPRFEACAQLLLNPKDPNSPWNKVPWSTPLEGP